MSSSVHGAGQNQSEAGGGGDNNDRKKAGAEEKVEKVPFLKLFSFADRWDYLLMAVGSVGACAHGASVPVFFIFFGKLINIIGIASFFPAMVSGRVAKVRALMHKPALLVGSFNYTAGDDGGRW